MSALSIICLAVLALAGLAALVTAPLLIIREMAARDKALILKLAELAETHMPTGEPISILKKKLDLQAEHVKETQRANEFKREQVAMARQQLAEHDEEQDP